MISQNFNKCKLETAHKNARILQKRTLQLLVKREKYLQISFIKARLFPLNFYIKWIRFSLSYVPKFISRNLHGL